MEDRGRPEEDQPQPQASAGREEPDWNSAKWAELFRIFGYDNP